MSTLRLKKGVGIDATDIGTLKEVLHDSSCQAHKAIVMSTLEIIGRKDTDQSLGLMGPPRKAIFFLNEPWTVGPGLHLLQRAPPPPNYLGESEGVINGRWIDRNLPFRWKVRCAKKHRSGMCQKPFPDQRIASARPEWLIDVWQRCLVRATESMPYVALSYVWGGAKPFNCLQCNVHELQIPSTLSAESKGVVLPRTIRDAMGLVELLRERYLWVDSLCIVQDGPGKQLQLAKMSAIYANAIVTIVAADGFDANHGLRGLLSISMPRSIQQKVFRLGRGRYVLEDDDAPGIGAKDRSLWATRGWTFQEQLFSRIKLFFERGQVVWRCADASWSEAEESTGARQMEIGNGQQDISLFLPNCPNIWPLVRILNQYNQRNFTYPEDCLRAFDGIAYALESYYEGGFVSGLPVAFFGVALLWQPRKQAVRRVATNNKASDENSLPSWSWAGWKGGLNLTNWGSVMDYIKYRPSAATPGAVDYHAFPTVSWAFRRRPGGEVTPMRESWQEQRFRYSNGEDMRSCPPGWTRHDISDIPYRKGDHPQPPSAPRAPRWIFKHASDTDNEYWYPIPIPASKSPESEQMPLSVSVPFISGRVRRAWAIGGESCKAPDPTIYLRDGLGKWIGAMQLHDHDDTWKPGDNNDHKWLELVEIARGQHPEKFRHPSLEPPKDGHEARPRSSTDGYVKFYFVLWIERVSGIAYRKGLGIVHKEAWEALGLKKIDLVLG